MAHKLERFRSQSENSAKPEPHVDNRERNCLSRSISSPGARHKSSGSESSTTSDTIGASVGRLSILDGDYNNRKTSTGSNSEYKFDTEDDSKYKGMIKSHYISPSKRNHCQQCNRKFSVKFRPHHCRRCGEIHCMKCLKYRRKLNRLANFDPNGKPRKVCKKCFNEERQTLGSTRRLTNEFCKERQLCKYERVLKQRTASLTNTFWRDELDMQKECSRLLDGFSAAVGTSEAKKTLSEIQELVKPPKWQKSSFWQVEKLAENCRVCKGGLGIRKKKRNCKVCGLALCKKCSNKELLLYIESKDGEHQINETKLAIIKVAGCPEKEPDISLLLHICSDCKEYISFRQTAICPPSDCVNSLIIMDNQFSQLQNSITPTILLVEQMFDSTELEPNHFGPEFDNLHGYLTELSNDLDTYEALFHRLRGHGKMTQTKTQANLIKHYTLAKYEYYMENRHIYRRLRNKIQPRLNNRPVLDTKQSGGKEEPGNMSFVILTDTDTDKARSHNKTKLVGGENDCCGGDKTDTSIRICKTKQTKKTNKSLVIKQKFISNKITPSTKGCECDEASANLATKTDGSDTKLLRKETLNKTTCYTMKGSLAVDDVTDGVERTCNKCVKNIVFEKDENSIETETSCMSSVNSRESGEVFLSDGIVSWKK